MSVHAFHQDLDGYHPDQVLVDGCEECERRGADVAVALGHLDAERFAAAWQRAGQYQRAGLVNGSRAELPLLRVLAAVEVKLERFGLPLGTVPR